MAVIHQHSMPADTIEALAAWRVWVRFGWHDVVSRYRRSWLGPLWVVVTMAITIGVIGFVYSVLFKLPIRDYLPFLALGMVVWSFVSAVSTEGVQAFVEAAAYIRDVRRSPLIYVCRVLWRNTIIFVNQLVVGLAVAALFGRRPDFVLLAVGMALLLLEGFWVALLIGIIGTRFRDVTPIVHNGLQILFFVTPVIWVPAMLGDNLWVATANPLFHVVELVRQPSLGTAPPALSYAVVGLTIIAGFAAAFAAYAKFGRRLVYWL